MVNYTSLEGRECLMKTFILTKFGCCSFTWMFYNGKPTVLSEWDLTTASNKAQ